MTSPGDGCRAMRCSVSRELYAEKLFGRIAAWCAAHGVQMSGHVDQEEPRNPSASRAT